jgi:hypothetical protein
MIRMIRIIRVIRIKKILLGVTTTDRIVTCLRQPTLSLL